MSGINVTPRLVLAKLENTAGTDAVPVVGTDDLFVLSDSAGIDQGVTVIGVQPASPTGRKLPQGIGSRKPTATYRIPLYGIGETSTVVDLPKWLSVLLQSCGHVNQDAGAGGGVQVDWTPDPVDPRKTDDTGTVTRPNPTFTLYDYVSGTGPSVSGTKELVKMVGCRVVSHTITMTVGEWAMLEVTIQGLWVLPVSSTADLSGWDLDGVRSDFLVPNGVASVFTFSGPGAVSLNSSSTVFTFDYAGEQVEGDSTGSGVAFVALGAPTVSMTTNPVIAAANINTWETAERDQAQVAYSLTTPMTAQGRTPDTGYTIDVAAPTVQFTAPIDRGGNVMRKSVAGALTSADGSTPEFTLSLT